MALDTQYRPRRFDDVLGQENTAAVLREFVRSGSGFHQSYLFCGAHGSGKTTLARILSRALLCENPQGGDPCDQCVSCKSMLEKGTSECFTEFDAATNSSKDDIKKLTESANFDTFSGKRRLYLIDESHRLSPAALDALLKPMEDTVQGSQDKMLVCIFCTTEPEKMKSTVFSRCAPAFVIRTVTPEKIADRLAFVCQTEGIEYEHEALVLIAEASECHIRDALKSVEGVSMLGSVNLTNVRSYLRLNANPLYLKLLILLGRDLAQCIQTIDEIQQVVSPATAYERLADLAMLSYRLHLGVGKPPSYWPDKAVRALGDAHGAFLLKIASLCASKPGHPTFAMLQCDMATLHFQRTGEMIGDVHLDPKVIAALKNAPTNVLPSTPIAQPIENQMPDSQQQGTITVQATPPAVSQPKYTAPTVTKGGVYVDPRGINRRDQGAVSQTKNDNPTLHPQDFKRVLQSLVAEMSVDGRGRST